MAASYRGWGYDSGTSTTGYATVTYDTSSGAWGYVAMDISPKKAYDGWDAPKNRERKDVSIQ